MGARRKAPDALVACLVARYGLDRAARFEDAREA
jgi:hypothetical protein